MSRIVILGAGESGAGAAVLAKKVLCIFDVYGNRNRGILVFLETRFGSWQNVHLEAFFGHVDG